MHREMMVDIETLDTSPAAHILSIGAVVMHDTNQQFYAVIGTVEQSRIVNMSTIDWWLTQSDAARNEVLIDTDVSLRTALTDFRQFYKDSGATKIWSHGDDFDTVILTHAMKQLDIPVPWQFWRTRDTRTLIDTAERLKGRNFEPNREGTHHNALHDAIFQANWMNAIWEELNDE